MPDKRPIDADYGGNDPKRARSNNGSPAPASGQGMPDAERRKQDAAARLAAVKAKLAASKPQNGAPTPPTTAPAAVPTNDFAAKRADAMRRIEEIKARQAAAKAGEGAGTASQPQQQQQHSQQQSEHRARIEEARARAAAMKAGRSATPTTPKPPPPRQDGVMAKGGLGIGLHPSLLQDTTKPVDSKSRGPKFGTAKGNQRADLRANPYLSVAGDEGPRKSEDQDGLFDPTIAAKKGMRERKSKGFLFNEKGKFIKQANALRNQAKLEEMKRRIAFEERKAEIEEATDKAYLVPAPPEVEWWDEGLLPEGQNSYNDWDNTGRNKIETEDSIITRYVQHPVLLKPPQDKFVPEAKPMMLTPKEQAKLRRQRRMENMKEEQAKIRLGLKEPPPPKVKKSNMMRVLGEQAVQDPTAVEARVNREIAQRRTDHEEANSERQLTDEQRKEKLARQQESDESKGVKIAVFKVNSLSSGKHRFQVDINAKQNALTGIVVLHPTMNLIVVEGGAHSVTAYKKLMLQRIKWQENTLPLSNATPTTFTGPPKDESTGGQQTKAQHAAITWLNPTSDDGELKDLSENACVLVWEGDERSRSFKKWSSRVCETDGEAKDVLSKNKMENMWTLARSVVADTS
ncbi:PRP3-domain-containing protein [Polychaeton citri CBS 116435]|uniref:PRP3-domain-containing protein n=1 Tax=Polychaeton citri CBS 116435 TaxID=1314669 RepID=A0A9P4USS8_9PEZI|nr:PRP3-domain-containing protein [Polychaeton citri CBS 116435]